MATYALIHGGGERLLVELVRASGLRGDGRRALMVGCGLGDDAELIAGLGFDTVAFDLVVESLTVQSMPDPPRARAIPRVASLVAPGGTLIVVATGRDEADEPSGPPWPLTRAEIDAFATDGIEAVRVEDIRADDAADSEVRRWRAEFRRA